MLFSDIGVMTAKLDPRVNMTWMFHLLLALLLGQAPASSCGVADEPEFATSKDHPVQVGGGALTIAARERRYLDALRGPEGQPVQYKRLGTERTADQAT